MVSEKQGGEIMEKEKDHCVLCGKETEYLKNTPVDEKNYYVEGGGQLCQECFSKIYD